ncbi:unnamed protein product, partial [Rotaria sordida]
MLSVPLTGLHSHKLKRQTNVEDDIDGQQNQPLKSLLSDNESNSSRSLSPNYIPDTSDNSRRSSNHSVVRFIQHDLSDLCSILDMTV